MDLGFLTVPLTMAMMAFGFAVFTDTQKVHIEYVDVPKAVAEETGYTSAVIIAKLADGMKDIERQARSRAQARKVELDAEKKPAAVLGEFLGVTPLIRILQESISLIPFKFSGEVVRHGEDVELTLRGKNAAKRQWRITQSSSVENMPRLIHRTAYEAMRILDPYILAAYQFKRDRLTRDFTPTLEIITRELNDTDPRAPKWLRNLWGMVLYQQADRNGAIEKFKEALAEDPNFLSPLLNWGVALARHGKQEEAIEKFRQVTLNPTAKDNPATVAAALSEWGFSLALLGRTKEAFAKFKAATKVDPTFSDVYNSWAEVLSDQGQPEEAARMTAQALKLTPTEVIYTENLIGAVQMLPATATDE
jgi:tetratricopeptide (TPR) repeat protein